MVLRNFNIISVVVCLLFGGAHLSWAQERSFFRNIQYFTTDNGLSQNEVTCIAQDQKGFLWIGTRGGLNRFDGTRFKVFQNEIGNPNSLINNSIESLFADSRGNIWVGTKSNGLSCYQPEWDRFTHYQHVPGDPETIAGNRIVTIAESTTGEIWVGAEGGGISVIDPEKQSCRRISGPYQEIGCIKRATDGNLWLVTHSDQIHVLSTGGDLVKTYRTSQENIEFSSLVEDTLTGKFYLAAWKMGLFEFDSRTEKFQQFQIGGKNTANFYQLHLDKQGQLWVGSWNGGLHRFDTQKREFIRYDLTDNPNREQLYKDVLWMFCDASDNFWFGTNGGGLGMIDKRLNQFGFIRKTHQTAAWPTDPIWSVLKDESNVLWVGSKGKAELYFSRNGEQLSAIEIPAIREGKYQEFKPGSRTFYQDRTGQLWFATNASLYRIDKAGESYHLKPVLIQLEGAPEKEQIHQISRLFQSPDGNFWIGTQQHGLMRTLEPGNPVDQALKSYPVGTGSGDLKSNRITSFLEDRTGRLWIGTYGGLHLYRPKSDDFFHYQKVQNDISSLSSDIIICLHEDRKGNLWIGTPNGLNMAVPGVDQNLTFSCFQEKDGLPNNYIHSILEDNSGNLWISTNKGISRFVPSEGIFFNFDIQDGLSSNSFMENVGFQDPEGVLYFGGINGLNVFHPDSIRNIAIRPKVVLTGLKIFNQEIHPQQTFNDRIILDKAIEYEEDIILKYNEDVFTIDFVALNFSNSSDNTFNYKMEGLEENWNLARDQRSVTYANLRPGNYTFRIKAADNNIWSEEEARLNIQILPPFWGTKQAFLLYLLTFAGLLLLYRYFINKQNALKNKLELSSLERKKEAELGEMKTQFFTNITHELRTPLTLITGPVKTMLGKTNIDSQQKYHLSTIHYHTEKLLGLVNQLLDFRKAESNKMNLHVAEGNFVNFAREIFLSFRGLAESKNILYQFNASQSDIRLTYDRVKMEVVLCNLLANAFKYTPEGKTVSLSVRQVIPSGGSPDLRFPDGCCEIIIQDTGLGMEKDLLDRIFDRFYQIANTNSVKMVGTGIGLALVKNIVDLHQGEISVESARSEGSQFTVRVPLGRGHFKAEQFIPNYKKADDPSHYQIKELIRSPKHELPAVGLHGEREPSPKLLVVEDNPEVREFIHHIFHGEFRIFTADDGKKGIAQAEKHQPDLIISDLMMPVMDGLEFCKELRNHEELAHIPVIILTARTASVFQLEGIQSGADVYITKPFDPQILIAQVKGILNMRSKLKEAFGKKITLQPTEIEITSLEGEFINSAVKVVEENLSNEDLNRDFLAQALAVSPSSLYRKLKALTGLNTNAFIRSIRLKRAAQMMQRSDYNISEIAYQVGFNDLKYFRTSFKKQFGMSPSQFVKDQEVKPAEISD